MDFNKRQGTLLSLGTKRLREADSLTILLRHKTVKNMDLDLLQACAVHGPRRNTSRWTTGTQINLIKDKWP